MKFKLVNHLYWSVEGDVQALVALNRIRIQTRGRIAAGEIFPMGSMGFDELCELAQGVGDVYPHPFVNNEWKIVPYESL